MSTATADATEPLYRTKFEISMMKGQPSDRQESVMDRITRDHEPDGDLFMGALAYPNFGEGDGMGPSTGLVSFFKPDATVRTTAFGPEVLAYRGIVRLDDMMGGFDDEKFRVLMEEFHDLAPTYAPKNVAASLECLDRQRFIDKREWEPELGPNGSVKITKDTDGRQNTYWLVVQAAPGMINDQLKQYIRNNPNMTYAQLLNDPLFNYSKNLVKRNGQRMMQNVVSQFRMKTSQDPVRDGGSYHAAYELPPNLLIPDQQHFTSTIGKVYQDGQERIAVYNDVIPASQCQKALVVDQGAWGGYAVFDTQTANTITGFPASTRAARHHSKVKLTPEDARVIDVRHRYATWADKPARVDHTNFPAVLMDNYDSVDRNDHFIERMQQLGLKKTAPVARLVPVAMKVASPTEKRRAN